MEQIIDDLPIALYNSDKKELVGVFATKSLAGRYIYPLMGAEKRAGSIAYYAKSKTKIRNASLGFNAVLRTANSTQIGELAGGEYKIFNGYKEPHAAAMGGFTDTYGSLKKGFIERVERRMKEEERQKTTITN